MKIKEVLADLEGPAAAIRKLMEQLEASEREKAILRGKVDELEARDERRRQQIAHMKGELYRAGPVASDDELTLARRNAQITYQLLGSTGRPRVALSLVGAKTVLAEDLATAIDQALGRESVRRGQA